MCPVARGEGLLHPYAGVAYVGSFCPLAGYFRVSPESRKVVNLPPDKNIPEGKPSSQNNRKWACVIGASIVFRGPSSGLWPCDRNVFLTLGVTS